MGNYLFTVNAEDQIFPQKLYFFETLYISRKKTYMTERITPEISYFQQV